MTPSTLADALTQARTDWLHGQRDAWARYTACVAQVRAIEQAREAAPVSRLPALPASRLPRSPRAHA